MSVSDGAPTQNSANATGCRPCVNAYCSSLGAQQSPAPDGGRGGLFNSLTRFSVNSLPPNHSSGGMIGFSSRNISSRFLLSPCPLTKLYCAKSSRCKRCDSSLLTRSFLHSLQTPEAQTLRENTTRLTLPRMLRYIRPHKRARRTSYRMYAIRFAGAAACTRVLSRSLPWRHAALRVRVV